MTSDTPQPAVTAPGSQELAPPRDRMAERLRGFGPVGAITAIVISALGPVIEPLAAVLVLLWRGRSRTPWRDLGFVRPKSWTLTVLGGIVLGVALKLAAKSIVLPLLGADPINRAYHYLAGNPAAIPGMLFTIIVGAGFGEELVFRGFMFERLGKLLGSSVAAKVATVLVTTAWFGLVHYPVQGWPGVEQAWFDGLVFGIIFAITGRIAPLMIAHAAFDLAALVIIYWNLETRVAHWFFR